MLPSTIRKLMTVAVAVLLLPLLSLYTPPRAANALSPLNGAWQIEEGDHQQLLLIADGYCMFSAFNIHDKKFEGSRGGSFSVTDKEIILKTEFDSNNKSAVGKINRYACQAEGQTLITNLTGSRREWKRADDGKSLLAGTWRITQRKQDDKMVEIPLRARRTLKLLTGSHFQWAAINIETGEFAGTGGGEYTFEDGKYTEHISFFSRDASRVGMSLSFDDKLEDGNWIHTGLSSKGDHIYEIWSRMK